MEKEISHSKPTISSKNVNTVTSILQSENIASGFYAQKFAKELSATFNNKDVILTNTGSSAILLALNVLNIEIGDEVILPTFVCSDVLNVITACRAKPILCDIGECWNTSMEYIQQHVSNRTKAIILPHNLGIQANTQGLKSIGLPLIEDCCLCLGRTLSGSLAGTTGDLTVLSFQATKCITTGEGGAVIFNNDKLKNESAACKYGHILRISDLQAGLGSEQLEAYNIFLAKRKLLADSYFEVLPKELTYKFKECYHSSVFFRFLIYGITDFEGFRKFMYQYKIHVRRGVDELLHRKFGLGSDDKFPNALNTYNLTASLPIYPSLEVKDVYRIAETVNKYWDGCRTTQ